MAHWLGCRIAVLVCLTGLTIGEQEDMSCEDKAQLSAQRAREHLTTEDIQVQIGVMGIDPTDADHLEFLYCTLLNNPPTEAARILTASGDVAHFVRFNYASEAATILLYGANQPVYFNALRSKGYFNIDRQAIINYLVWDFNTPLENAVEMVNLDDVPYVEGCQMFADALLESRSNQHSDWNYFVTFVRDHYGLNPANIESYGQQLCQIADSDNIDEMVKVFNSFGVPAHFISYARRTGTMPPFA